MRSFQIKTDTDADGMIAVNAYNDDQTVPFTSSGFVFHTEDEARAGILGMIEAAWPAKDPFSVDSSIGV